MAVNDPADGFQFAVVSDRTGQHREKVFSRAMHLVNLLPPAFVVSVGDLIEGYTPTPEAMAADWDQFNGFLKPLGMPFFYAGGNHDLGTKAKNTSWDGRYGRRQYHFTYKNVLFLVLNAEDLHTWSGRSTSRS